MFSTGKVNLFLVEDVYNRQTRASEGKQNQLVAADEFLFRVPQTRKYNHLK